MRRRYRWYLFDSEEDIDFLEVSKRMLALPYGDGRLKGFRLDTATSTRVEGEFVEEIRTEVEVISPLGGVHRYSTIQFSIVAFQMARQPLSIRLTDPPRSVRSLFVELRDLLGSTPETPQIDVRAWFNKWERQSSAAMVRDMLLADVTVSRSTRASIRFAGAGDVRQDASRFLSGREPAVSRATFEFADGDSLGKCELRANCSATVSAWRPAQVAEELWSAFLEVEK